jgi:hypothetical protein
LRHDLIFSKFFNLYFFVHSAFVWQHSLAFLCG